MKAIFLSFSVALAQPWWARTAVVPAPELPTVPIAEYPARWFSPLIPFTTQELQCAGVWHLQYATSYVGDQRLADDFMLLNNVQMTITPQGNNDGYRSNALITLMLGNAVTIPVRMHNNCAGEIEMLGAPVLRNAFGWRTYDPTDPMSQGLHLLGEFARHLFASSFNPNGVSLALRAAAGTFQGPSDVTLHFTPILPVY